ncbi:MAG TPA: hypothetical protein VIG42_08650 [Solirubrobacteraceae bacterium]
MPVRLPIGGTLASLSPLARIVIVGVMVALLSGCGSANSGHSVSAVSATTKAVPRTPEGDLLSRAAVLRGRLLHAGFTVEPAGYHAASSRGESTPSYAALEATKHTAVPVQIWVFASDQDAERIAAQFKQLDAKNPGHGALRRVGADFYLQASASGGVSQAVVASAAAAAEAMIVATVEAGAASDSG